MARNLSTTKDSNDRCHRPRSPRDKVFALPSGELKSVLKWLDTAVLHVANVFHFLGIFRHGSGLGKDVRLHVSGKLQPSVRGAIGAGFLAVLAYFTFDLVSRLSLHSASGNRCSEARNRWNPVIVFFLFGLWHVASGTFVIWGLYHGVFVVGRTRLGQAGFSLHILPTCRRRESFSDCSLREFEDGDGSFGISVDLELRRHRLALQP